MSSAVGDLEQKSKSTNRKHHLPAAIPNLLWPGPRRAEFSFLVKHSRKYALTGGWGFAQFNDGKPADEALHKTGFACHEPAKARDFVFTPYAP
jgi:hypothetical protein